MKCGRRMARLKKRVTAVALTMMVMGASLAPIVPASIGVARAEPGWGTIVHSSDGVLLRAEPDFSAAVLTTLPEGSGVSLRTFEADTVYDADGVTQWWPISNRDQDGWVAGFYLQIDGYGTLANDPAENEAAAPAAPAADSAIGGEGASAPIEEPILATWDLANAFALVAEPEGVNMRQDPGANSPAVRALSLDTVVQLRVDEMDTVYTEGSRWWPVRVDGLVGWVSGAYLAPTEAWTPPAPAEEAWVDPGTGEAPGKVANFFQAGSYVIADTDEGVGVNIRADGAPDSERIGIVPEDDVVQVMDGPSYDPIGNPWYLITNGAVTGFVNGAYFTNADQPGADMAQDAIVPPKVSVPGVASGAFQYPLENWTFTQAFGCSPYWFEPWDSNVGCNFHNGADLAAPAYTPLLAADGGTVEYAGWCDCGLGYYVKIDHGNGFETLYGHMAEMPYVSAGQAVAKGDVIGPVGSTGISTGPHVHFIVKQNGVDVDPLLFLP